MYESQLDVAQVADSSADVAGILTSVMVGVGLVAAAWLLGVHFPETRGLLMGSILGLPIVVDNPTALYFQVKAMVPATANPVLDLIGYLLSVILTVSVILDFTRQGANRDNVQVEYTDVTIMKFEPGLYGLKGYNDGTLQSFLLVEPDVHERRNSRPFLTGNNNQIWTVAPRFFYRTPMYSRLEEQSFRVPMEDLRAIEEYLWHWRVCVNQNTVSISIANGASVFTNCDNDVLVIVRREGLACSPDGEGTVLVKELARRHCDGWDVNVIDVFRLNFRHLVQAQIWPVATTQGIYADLQDRYGRPFLTVDAENRVQASETYAQELSAEAWRLCNHLSLNLKMDQAR